MALNEQQERLCDPHAWDFSDLRALFLNCTLTDRGFDFGRSVLSGPRGRSGWAGGLVAVPKEGAIRSGEPAGQPRNVRARSTALAAGRNRFARRDPRTPTARAVTAAFAKSTALINPPTRRARPVPGPGRTAGH